MGFIVQNFNPNQDTGISPSLTSLSTGSIVASPEIGNGPPANEIYANIQLTVTMSGDGTNTSGPIVCYIARSLDQVNFDDDVSIPQSFNLSPLATFSVDSTSTNTYKFSMDTDITGPLPFSWEFVVFNDSSGTIASGSAIYCNKEYYAF